MITKRGKRVRAAAIAVGVALILWIAGNVWYVPGEGYCFGSMQECYGKEFTR